MKNTIALNYLPQSEDQLLSWLKNFSSHLPTLGIQLGVTPAEAASLNALILSVKNDIRNENRNSEEKEQKKKAMLNFLEMLVNRMKNNPHYSEVEHGNKFGIS